MHRSEFKPRSVRTKSLFSLPFPSSAEHWDGYPGGPPSSPRVCLLGCPLAVTLYDLVEPTSGKVSCLFPTSVWFGRAAVSRKELSARSIQDIVANRYGFWVLKVSCAWASLVLDMGSKTLICINYQHTIADNSGSSYRSTLSAFLFPSCPPTLVCVFTYFFRYVYIFGAIHWCVMHPRREVNVFKFCSKLDIINSDNSLQGP